jgi:hypothetical protein
MLNGTIHADTVNKPGIFAVTGIDADNSDFTILGGEPRGFSVKVGFNIRLLSIFTYMVKNKERKDIGMSDNESYSVCFINKSPMWSSLWVFSGSSKGY